MSKVKLYTTVVILSLLGQASLLLAQDTPVSIRGTGASSSSGTYTGFVETNYDDPNWVLVISDSILRANLYLENWYEKVFDPCYNYNRYWKLAPGAKTGLAFPMSAFGTVGTGSLDSFYVPEAFGFQLYDGTTGEPCSPYLGGAKYVSLTHWRDFPAPDGFEPGTLFVPGDRGDLEDYSIIVCRYPLRLHKTHNAPPEGVEQEDYVSMRFLTKTSLKV